MYRICFIVSSLFQQASLPGLPLFEALVQQAEQLDVAYQTPRGLVDETRRNFSDETLYMYVRTESLQDVGKEIQILF